MNTFSFSRLSKFVSCPAAFYAAYVAGIEEGPSYPLLLGKAVHNVIEAAMRLDRRDEEFFRVTSKAVADSLENIDVEEVFKLSCQDAVLREFSPENRVEEHVIRPLDESENIFLQGYIDLCRESEGETRVIDWKTNWQEYDPLENHQLALYAWCLKKEPVRGKLVFLRHGRSIEHKYTEKELENARRWALDTAKTIRHRLSELEKAPSEFPQIFPATPGEACRYCGCAANCIEYPLPNPEDVDTYEKAKELAAEAMRMEGALNGMKNKLQEYVEACGPVKLEKKMYTSRSDSYWTWDIQAKKEALKKLLHEGREPFKYFNLTSSQLKKLGWSRQVISGLGAQLKEKKPQLKLVNRD
ncbi:MAG: PD-(D/E)XK nuclease family protein [Clostridiales bacterium]|nr:PD-(D/E)XK nuclease family protein [Clostridiales bacterium]MCF8022642.1 PD-(D/E)XK nuclease family protein [Clostridiales bacterium]